jgi:hypothetical protein
MNTIQSDKLYWATGNYHEFRIIGEAIIDIAQSGDNAESVAYWADKVRKQVETDNLPNRPTQESIVKELSEYGAWDGDELSDHEQNWHRILWIAAWEIFDSEEPDCSDPVIDDDDVETAADKEYADRVAGHAWSNC